ncbi:MAG TPA: YciI family protein [Rubrivivax sp.]|nr:YciI family protein [Rubrivivax sp.]
MRYLLLVYTDQALLDAMPPAAFDAEMKHCLEQADAMQADSRLVAFEQLEAPSTARSVRVRGGRTTVLDGPFTETKEMLAGFNLIEADSIDEAVRIAQTFPWTQYGCIEVRPVRDVAAVRARVGARGPAAV